MSSFSCDKFTTRQLSSVLEQFQFQNNIALIIQDQEDIDRVISEFVSKANQVVKELFLYGLQA